MKLQTITILVIEENPDDCASLRAAFEACMVKCQLEFAGNSIVALDFLRSRAKPPGHLLSLLPNLILLNLNISEKNGIKLLQEIKSSPEFGHIPVIVLTNSKAPNDILESYRAGASSFINKPASLEQLQAIVQNIKEYWLNTATLV